MPTFVRCYGILSLALSRLSHRSYSSFSGSCCLCYAGNEEVFFRIVTLGKRRMCVEMLKQKSKLVMKGNS